MYLKLGSLFSQTTQTYDCFLRKLYSIDYLLKLKSLLKSVDSNVSIEEIYRLAFGTHYNESNFSKRPLSKMKRDILEELGMILK